MMGRLAGLGRAASRVRARELLDALRPHRGRPPPRRRPTPAGCGGAWISPRASSRGPSVLFLDEPTTGLDPRSRLVMWDVIGGLVDAGVYGLPDHAVPRGGRPAGRPRRGARRRPRGRRGHARPSSSGRPPTSASTSCSPTPRPSTAVARSLAGRVIARDARDRRLGVATDGSAAHVRALLDEVDPGGDGGRALRRPHRDARRRLPRPHRPHHHRPEPETADV